MKLNKAFYYEFVVYVERDFYWAKLHTLSENLDLKKRING